MGVIQMLNEKIIQFHYSGDKNSPVLQNFQFAKFKKFK